jgi:bifunctional lysine-specific demethylase and histidyl-hydroxylase NO66
MSILRSLVSVSPEVFKSKFLGNAYLLSKTDEIADRFPIEIFKNGIFDSLGSGGLRSSSVRIVRDGIDYSGVVGTVAPGDGGIAEPYIEGKYLSPLLADGYTIVARSIHRYLEPAYELTGLLSSELGYPARIAAYITPPGNRGLLWHFDAHDVFIVQLEGSKVWHVAPPAVKWPIPEKAWHHLRASERAAITSQIREVTDLNLAAGDVLYLPRGYLHAPETHDELSVHMTISIHPLTRFDVAKALIDESANSEWWRESIDMKALVDDVQAAKAALEAIASRMSQDASDSLASDIFWRARNQSREERASLRLRNFVDQSRAILDVSAYDTYVRNEGIGWRIGETNECIILYTDIGDARLPKAAYDIILDIMRSPALELAAFKTVYPTPLTERVLAALLRIGIISPRGVRGAEGDGSDFVR